MFYQEGYTYHIKDEYFQRVTDKYLMQNKENGNYRPTFYCLKDSKTHLLWMIPLSSKYNKFKKVYDKQLQKYGKCHTIVLDEFDNKPAAFLIQNAFPITEKYLDHIHTRNQTPIPIQKNTHLLVKKNFKKLYALHKKGFNTFFTNINYLEQEMLRDISNQT